MSQTPFEAFLDKLKTESRLQDELNALLGKTPDDPSVTVSEFAALGAKHGFDFSAADIMALQDADGELTEGHLEAVAGGGGTEQEYYTTELVNASTADVGRAGKEQQFYSVELVNASIADAGDNTARNFKLRLD